MNKQFFSYSPDLGIAWHDTAEAAKASAEEQLKQYRKDAQFDGEWPTEVEDIRWGEVKERTAAASHDEGGCDYALKAVEGNPVAEIQALRKDAERFAFMLRVEPFIVWKVRDGSINQCQAWTQDEDENYIILSGEHRFFNSEREAIDAAMLEPPRVGVA